MGPKRGAPKAAQPPPAKKPGKHVGAGRAEPSAPAALAVLLGAPLADAAATATAASASSGPIRVSVLGSSGFVWTAEEALRLRLEHRLIGAMVGTLPGFRAQNAVLGLPLMLCAEEVALALAQGWVELLPEPTAEAVRASAGGANAVDAAAEAAAAARKQQQDEEFAEFYAGLGDSEDDEEDARGGWGQRRGTHAQAGSSGGGGAIGPAAADAWPQRMPPSWAARLRDAEKTFLAIPLERGPDDLPPAAAGASGSGPPQLPPSEAFWSFPSTAAERRRLAAFSDLHGRGYTLTSGFKFGADFLAYPGDPILYHAQFCVRVQDGAEPMPPLGLAAAARVAHAARKHLLLAYPAWSEGGGGDEGGDGSAGPIAGARKGGPAMHYLTVAPETMFGRAYT